jgi:hypothetical protein
MPIQYLLPCSCGRKQPVETRQAGEVVTCECGAPLPIPRLLELKMLEVATKQTTTSSAQTTWGVGHGLALAGTLILLGAIILGIRVHSTSSGYLTPDQIREKFAIMPPSETWDYWLYYKNKGINPPKDRFFEASYNQNQFYLAYVGIVAVSGLALMGVGFFITRRNRAPHLPPGAR